jgi:NAD(P)-dependent dehydrogenase (short-subunit alcohol dehydrogenase family)
VLDLDLETNERADRVQSSAEACLISKNPSGFCKLSAASYSWLSPPRRSRRRRSAVGEIEAAGGEAEFVRADLESPDDVRALAERAANMDILIDNAGVFPAGATHELPEATFDQTFVVNVKAPFLLTAAIAPRMVERGGGTIINVTTMAAEYGMAGLSAYGAWKAAVALLTKAWAAEYSPKGVRVSRLARPDYHTWHRRNGRHVRRDRVEHPARPRRRPGRDVTPAA